MSPPLCSLIAVILGVSAGAAGRWWSFSPENAPPPPATASGPVTGKSTGLAASGKPGSAAVPGTSGEAPGRPGITEIMALRGFAQTERFAAWLPGAGLDDLRTFALALKDSSAADTTLFDALFLRWVELDPADAISFSRQHQNGTVAWWAWGKLHPEEALAAAVKERGTWSGSAALRGIAQTDPAKAMELMAQYPQFAERTALEGMVSALFRTDPAAAAEMALKVESTEVTDSIKAWSMREPDSALAWALGLDSPAQRRRMLEAVISQWEDTSPERVASALDAMPPSQTKNKLTVEHAGRLALTDRAAAVAFAKGQTNPAVRQAAMATIVTTLAADQPHEALTLLQGDTWTNTDVANRTGTGSANLQSAVLKLARHLPEETMQYAESIGSAADGIGNSVRQAAFRGWMETDVTNASAWLAAKPAAERDEQCVSSLVSHLSDSDSGQDFAAAAAWAVTLTKNAEHNWHLDQVFRRWHRQDPEGARAGLGMPGIPETLRTQLQTRFSNP